MASMSEFEGFSDREIRTIQRKGSEKTPTSVPPRKADLSSPRRNPSPKIARGRSVSHTTPPSQGGAELPQTAYFVQQTQQAPIIPKPDQPETKLPLEKDPNTDSDHQETVHQPSSTDPPTEASTVRNDDIVTDLCLDSRQVAESNLELLQKQQKALKDENKKKKALVEQTLQERYARSQMETETLHRVKEELTRLDSLLNRDVTILRSRIEEADRQYTAARRRYDRAEAEFIAAKLVFHRASEAKELLSEHLCTIIQEHEMRKAEKLSDLLKTLELENQDKDSPHLQSRVVSGNALFQKTPTPGTNIWPRERLGSNNEKPPIKRGTDSEQVTDDAKHHTVKEANDRLYDNLEQNRETGLISSSGCPRPEPLPSAANTQDTGADSDSDTPLITL